MKSDSKSSSSDSSTTKGAATATNRRVSKEKKKAKNNDNDDELTSGDVVPMEVEGGAVPSQNATKKAKKISRRTSAEHASAAATSAISANRLPCAMANNPTPKEEEPMEVEGGCAPLYMMLDILTR